MRTFCPHKWICTHLYCVGVCGRTCSSVSSAVIANVHICIVCVWLCVCVGGWVFVCDRERECVCLSAYECVCVCACVRVFVCVCVRSWVRVGARAHTLEQIRLGKRKPERKRSREIHCKNENQRSATHYSIATYCCNTLLQDTIIILRVESFRIIFVFSIACRAIFWVL